MNLEKIQSITMSLLKKEGDVTDGTAEYSKLLTARFTMPPDFPKTEDMFSLLVKDMYEDLKKNAPKNADSLGIWVELDSITLENALSLGAMDDIAKYSDKSVNVAYEFFKMTLSV